MRYLRFPLCSRFGAMLVEWTMAVSHEGVVASSARMADWCCHWWRGVRVGCRFRQSGRRRIGDARADFNDADLAVQLYQPRIAGCAGYNNNVFDSAVPTHDNNWTSRLDYATFDNGGHHHDIARSWW